MTGSAKTGGGPGGPPARWLRALRLTPVIFKSMPFTEAISSAEIRKALKAAGLSAKIRQTADGNFLLSEPVKLASSTPVQGRRRASPSQAVALQRFPHKPSSERPIGLLRNRIEIAEDFNAPLPDATLAGLYSE